MNPQPTLSVVVPNYNHGRFLRRSLEAMLRQSVPPSEVLVIDDASTDNSMEILQDLARQYSLLNVHRNERNQGVVFGMNRGIELARGDYLFFAAADDEVQPGLFEKSLALLGQHPQAALSCAVSHWHDEVSGLDWYMSAGLSARPCYFSPEAMVELGKRHSLVICTSGTILRRATLLECGGFLPELRWHCDWFATTIPALRHGMCYIPEALSDFYLHPASYYNRGRKSPEHQVVLRNLLDKLSSPAFADVAPRVRDSLVLAMFGLPMLRLLRQPRYRQFLTPGLVLRASRRSFELFGKKILPKPLARLALNLFYRGK